MAFERNLSLTASVSIATYLGMLAVGAVNSSYGAALEVLRQSYGVGDAQIGLLGTAQTVGGVLGNLSLTWLAGRVPAGARLGLGALGFSIGALGFALSSSFAAALAALLLMGFGLGLFQVSFAALFSRGFGARSGSVMTVMSTSFAVGSIVGPALTALLGGNYRLLPIGFALLNLVVALVVLPARDLPRGASRGTEGSAAHGALDLITWGFAGMILLYVIAEQGASFWAVTHLEHLGLPHETAAFTVSSFWLALMLGRFAAAALGLRFASQRLVRWGLGLAVLCLAATHLAPLAAPAYIAAGLFLAPVFPAGLAWLARVNPSPAATTLYFVAGSLGASLGLPLIGLLKSALGAGSIATALTLTAAGAALLAFTLHRLETQRTVHTTHGLNSAR